MIDAQSLIGVGGGLASAAASPQDRRPNQRVHCNQSEYGGSKLPKPRKSLEQLRLSGTFAKNPGRYADRYEPPDDRPIGEPCEWLPAPARAAWREMVPTLPWLRYCHRGIVGLTALLVGKMRSGTLGIAGLRALNQCLGSLGATPASFPKVGWAPAAEDADDPANEFFR